MFARLANSLFLEWRAQQPKPAHQCTTDFAALLAAAHAHARRVLVTVTARPPNLHSPS